MELAAGTAVDRFVVEGLVGRGGMASVYRIRHRMLNVAYALKVMHVTHPELADRIRSEGALQAELRHPNIVTVFDMIEVGGLPALVMEYVDGPSMAALLAVHQPTPEQIDELARGMLKGVRAAHAAGLIHRDIKPANVLLAQTDDGYLPKITDFGLAKSLDGNAAAVQTRTGVVMGTPSYMAPEQFRNTRSVDARADVYSLGVVLYELCAGRRPYDEEDLFDLLDRVRNADYPRITELVPQLPDRMADAIEGAMSTSSSAWPRSTRCTTWCGHTRMERSQAWNRAVLQRIGRACRRARRRGWRSPGRAAVGLGGGGAGAGGGGACAGGSGGGAGGRAGAGGRSGACAGSGGGGRSGGRRSRCPRRSPSPRPSPSRSRWARRWPTAKITRAFEPIVRQVLDDLDEEEAETEKVRAVSTPLLAAAAPEPGGRGRGLLDAPPRPGHGVGARGGRRRARRAHEARLLGLARAAGRGRLQVSILVQSAPSSSPSPAATTAGAAKPLAGPLADARLHAVAAPPRAAHEPHHRAAQAPPWGAPCRGWPRRPWRPSSPSAAPCWCCSAAPCSTRWCLAALIPARRHADEALRPSHRGAAAARPDQVPDADAGRRPAGRRRAGCRRARARRAGRRRRRGAGAHPGEAEAARPVEGQGPAHRDATSIHLVGNGKTYSAGWVPEGTYELRATFPGQGELKQRASVTVRKGRTVTVNCVAGFFSCTVK
ncbi:MAG: serine/threonine-protein kinase [Myxococcota bacterium]